MRQINMGFMKVNQVGLASAITFNQSEEIRSFCGTKKNQGFGQEYADGTRFIVNNGVLDSDLVDNHVSYRVYSNKKRGK